MIKLRNCPRCGGNVLIDSDFDGSRYDHCLQCGHRRYHQPKLPAMMTAQNRKARQTGARKQVHRMAAHAKTMERSATVVESLTNWGMRAGQTPLVGLSLGREGATMKIRGIKASDSANREFDLVTDDNGWLLLMNEGDLLACFDPKEYTFSGLTRDMETVLYAAAGQTAAAFA